MENMYRFRYNSLHNPLNKEIKFPLEKGEHRIKVEWFDVHRKPNPGESCNEYYEYAKRVSEADCISYEILKIE